MAVKDKNAKSIKQWHASGSRVGISPGGVGQGPPIFDVGQHLKRLHGFLVRDPKMKRLLVLPVPPGSKGRVPPQPRRGRVQEATQGSSRDRCFAIFTLGLVGLGPVPYCSHFWEEIVIEPATTCWAEPKLPPQSVTSTRRIGLTQLDLPQNCLTRQRALGLAGIVGQKPVLVAVG